MPEKQEVETKQEPEQQQSPQDNEADQIISKWKDKQAVLWNSLTSDTFTANASAYTASADECGKSDGITASGVKAETNRTIACPARFPFGAKIEIDGMGTYVCEDRGGAIKGNRIDIYMQNKKEAFAFGRQMLTAHVVIN